MFFLFVLWILKPLPSIKIFFLFMHCKKLTLMYHMGIFSNRSIFIPLIPFLSLKQNSCTYYVQYNANAIGFLHCAIRAHNDYVILLFRKGSPEITLSNFLG